MYIAEALLRRRDRPIQPSTSGAAGAGVLDTTLAASPARHTRNGEPRVHRPAPPRCRRFQPRRFAVLDSALHYLQVMGFTLEDTVEQRLDSILGEGA